MRTMLAGVVLISCSAWAGYPDGMRQAKLEMFQTPAQVEKLLGAPDQTEQIVCGKGAEEQPCRVWTYGDIKVKILTLRFFIDKKRGWYLDSWKTFQK